MPFNVPEENAVVVQNLTAYFKLCCRDRAPCVLCLIIETEINSHPGEAQEDEGHSGNGEEDDEEETERNFKGIIYMSPTCYWLFCLINLTIHSFLLPPPVSKST